MTRTAPFRFRHLPPRRRLAQFARAVLGVALLAALLCGVAKTTGQTRSALPQPIGQAVAGGLDENAIASDADHEKLLRTLNADRQKSLVADTNKLLRLVNELNAEIVSTNPDSLTPAQLHKVAEIEKLAHNVKDKMSTSVRGTPPFEQPRLRMH